MRAFAVDSFGAAGSVHEVPVPKPGEGEVLAHRRSRSGAFASRASTAPRRIDWARSRRLSTRSGCTSRRSRPSPWTTRQRQSPRSPAATFEGSWSSISI